MLLWSASLAMVAVFACLAAYNGPLYYHAWNHRKGDDKFGEHLTALAKLAVSRGMSSKHVLRLLGEPVMRGGPGPGFRGPECLAYRNENGCTYIVFADNRAVKTGWAEWGKIGELYRTEVFPRISHEQRTPMPEARP